MLDLGIRKTVQFYEYAMRSSDFKNQRKAILDSLDIPSHVMVAIRKRLKEVYGVEKVWPDNDKSSYRMNTVTFPLTAFLTVKEVLHSVEDSAQ